MALGKNAKKREARKAFHNDNEAQGAMPFAFYAIEYRNGIRRKLTFASLSSFKEYRERFFPTTAKGQLVLVSDLDSVDDSRKDAARKAATNRGLGLGNEDRFKRTKTPAPKTPEARAVSGKRFGKLGADGMIHKTTIDDAMASQARDAERAKAIADQEGLRALQANQKAFAAMRRTIRAGKQGL